DTSGNYYISERKAAYMMATGQEVCRVLSGSNVPFDGNAHTATGACKGVDGGALAGLVLTGTTHTAAGDYPSDPWTFTDTSGNYKIGRTTGRERIGNADADGTLTTTNKSPYAG